MSRLTVRNSLFHFTLSVRFILQLSLFFQVSRALGENSSVLVVSLTFEVSAFYIYMCVYVCGRNSLYIQIRLIEN